MDDGTQFNEYLNDRLKDPEFRQEYEALDSEFTYIEEAVKLRHKKNISQRDLAKMIGSSQSAIGHFESGSYDKTSMAFLRKLADALGADIEIHFKERTTG